MSAHVSAIAIRKTRVLKLSASERSSFTHAVQFQVQELIDPNAWEPKPNGNENVMKGKNICMVLRLCRV